MYMPKKPIKWGYKLWCMAEISGYVFDFEVVGGMGTTGTSANIQSIHRFGESENVVLRLTSELSPKKHEIFFANLVASPELLIQQKSMDIYVIGTLRQDRTRGYPLPTKSVIRKEGCGTMCEFVEKKAGLVICSWYDNWRFITISNFLGNDPISQANRFDHKNRKMIQVPCPASVDVYNYFMGGVDKADLLLSLCRIKMRCRKWYHRIVVHLMSLALINSYTVYRKMGGAGSLLDFQLDVCRCLLKADQSINSDEDVANPVTISRSSSANQVPVPVRHDRVNHWPIKSEKINRCKQSGCTKCTRFICSKCQVYLCVLSDCFINFHGVE